MARRYTSNIAEDTYLVNGIDAVATSLEVNSSTGWPSVPFALVIDPGTADEEIIQVGGKSGTTFSSLTRGYDGTSGKSHLALAVIKHVVISDDVQRLYLHDHDSAGGYTQVDHGDLLGLGDDDHSIYHTDARALTWLQGTPDTDDLTEGSNLYYTEARVSANTDVAANSSHRVNTSNPHSVTAAQASALALAGGTLTGALTLDGTDGILVPQTGGGGQGSLKLSGNGSDNQWSLYWTGGPGNSTGYLNIFGNSGDSLYPILTEGRLFFTDTSDSIYMDGSTYYLYINDSEVMRLNSAGTLSIGDRLNFGIASNDYIISQEADNAMKFFLDGVEQMRITSTGDLHLAGDAVVFDTIGGNDYIYCAEGSNEFAFWLDGAERASINSSGTLTLTNGDVIALGGDISGTGSVVRLRAHSAGDDYVRVDGSTPYIDFVLNGTQRAIIDSGGNLQIDGDLTISGLSLFFASANDQMYLSGSNFYWTIDNTQQMRLNRDSANGRTNLYLGEDGNDYIQLDWSDATEWWAFVLDNLTVARFYSTAIRFWQSVQLETGVTIGTTGYPANRVWVVDNSTLSVVGDLYESNGSWGCFYESDEPAAGQGSISTTYSSSARYKKNIVPGTLNPRALLDAKVKEWDWDHDEYEAVHGHRPNRDRGIGLVAEDLFAQEPRLVGLRGGQPEKIMDGKPLQDAILTTLQYLDERITALEAV